MIDFMLNPDYVPTSSITVDDPALPDWAPAPNPEDVRPRDENEYGLSLELIQEDGKYPSVTVDLNTPFTTGTSLEVFEVVIADDNDLYVTVEYKKEDSDKKFEVLKNSDGKPLDNVHVATTSFKVDKQNIGVLRVKVISTDDETAEQYHFTLAVYGCGESYSKCKNSSFQYQMI